MTTTHTTKILKKNKELRIGNRGGLQHFSQLTVWQSSKALCVLIYTYTKTFPNEEKFGLINQVRPSSISILSNIAEGFGRISAGDKAKFYSIARGSLDEVECQLLIAYELNMLNMEQLNVVTSLCGEIKMMLNSLIKKTASQNL